MGLQSIGAAQLAAAQPIGTSAIRFSGYSSLGNYAYTTSLPAASYLFYPIAANASCEFIVWSSNNNKSTFSLNNTTSLIKLTTTETSFNIVQYGVYNKISTTIGTGNLDAVVYGNSTYIIGGENGALATSTDGISWTTRSSSLGVTQIYGLSYGGGVFVCAARGGLLSTSTDGITWTTRNALSGGFDFNFARYVNGYHYVGGASGVLRRSTDGVTWSSASSHTMTTYDIAYGVVGGTGYYVLVGTSGYVSSGTDGVTWTSRTGFGSSDVRAVTYGNGLFVAGGSGGLIRTSTNGQGWTTQTSNFGTSTIWGLTYYNGLFIAVGDSGTVRTSTNGITWTSRISVQQTTGTFTDVVVGDKIVIPVSGTGGEMYNSVSESQFALYDASSSATLN